jgi:hypothetical protein
MPLLSRASFSMPQNAHVSQQASKGGIALNLIVFLPKEPDWIIVNAAGVLRKQYQALSIRNLHDPSLDLGTLRENDTLVLIGHGAVGSNPDWGAADLAKELEKKKLPKCPLFIRLATCNSAAEHPDLGSFAAQLQSEMIAKGYKDVSLTGSPGRVIYGFAEGPMVLKMDAVRDSKYYEWQDDYMKKYEELLEPARAMARQLEPTSSSDAVVVISEQISDETALFHHVLDFNIRDNFIDRDEKFGAEEVEAKPLQVHKLTIQVPDDPQMTTALRAPRQQVRIRIQETSAVRVIPATFLKWEGRVGKTTIDVEAPGGLSAALSNPAKKQIVFPGGVRFDLA